MKALLLRYRPKREHLLRLLLSLALALVVWVYVTISSNPETQFSFESVPVEVQGLAAGLVLTDEQGMPNPARTRVTIVISAPQSEHIDLNMMKFPPDDDRVRDEIVRRVVTSLVPD